MPGYTALHAGGSPAKGAHVPQLVTLVPFDPAHVAALGLRASAAAALAGLDPRPELARSYAAAGPAWTLMAAGCPLVCGGAVRFWDGVGELWCWTGADAPRWGVAFARQARERVDALFARGFHRLQAHVRADDAQAARFARFLGLRPEGRCPGYGPDQSTHLLYGRFFAWKE
jgi:hypothetical protein